MTSYWDSLQRQVSTASTLHRGNEMTFLLSVNQIEARAIRAVEAIAQLPGFPDDLKDKIARAIELSKTPDALSYRCSVRSSELISDLHSIFHQVATRKIKTSFGELSDNPEGTLKRLAANGADEFVEHTASCAFSAQPRAGWCNGVMLCEVGAEIKRRWKQVHDLMLVGVTDEEPT